MPRLNKMRKAQKYRYNMSRKRSNKKERSTGIIQCPEIRKAWENRKTMTSNLNDIGLGYDANKVLAVPSAKADRVKLVKLVNGFLEEDDLVTKVQPADVPRTKGFVMEQMEEDANALRESHFRLPKGIVSHLTYMMDNYDLDYKAMVRDEKNYDQITWKQYRAKIRRFMGIPEQFEPYLVGRGFTRDTMPWEECDSDHDL